jgi:chorismate synthase
MSSIFGTLFRISSWGESHGRGIGVVIDGCPPLVPLSEADVQEALDRRRPGQSSITTPRREKDTVEILSGVFEGTTTGTPISMAVFNEDQRSSDYSEMKEKFRPSHADFTYQEKYGIRDYAGGGRSSARETIARVAAGAVASKILQLANQIEIRAFIRSIHDVELTESLPFPSREEVESTPVRCPHPETAERMIARIKEVRDKGDSVGGVVECRVRSLPTGWGSPVFDRLEADLAKAMLSLPATKGFEVGSGFAGTLLRGSEHNDPFEMRDGKVRTQSNRSGGVQGGISNGEELIFRIAFKPTATVRKNQKTVSKDGEDTELAAKGRHDPCVVPRAVPIVEAMTALVLVDHAMRHHAQTGTFSFPQ